MSSEFKIAAAQIPSVQGDIDQNIATHVAAIACAAEHQVSMLVFPELSLTGYEPELASELALASTDSRLLPLLALARDHQITCIVGAPLYNGTPKPALGAIVLTGDGAMKTYAKMHLGGSEPTYFTPGGTPLTLHAASQTIGVAICADASRPSHPEAYAAGGATIYAAGVFLNAEWYETDAPRLAAYAARYQMLVMMANHATSTGTYTSVGRSAVWAPGGALLAQAPGGESALLIATGNQGAWRGELVRI